MRSLGGCFVWVCILVMAHRQCYGCSELSVHAKCFRLRLFQEVNGSKAIEGGRKLTNTNGLISKLTGTYLLCADLLRCCAYNGHGKPGSKGILKSHFTLTTQ